MTLDKTGFVPWQGLASFGKPGRSGCDVITHNKEDGMSISKWLASALIVLGLFHFIGCKKKQPEWKGTIETKGDVIIVRNPKEPMYSAPVLELTEDLLIEGSEEVEERMFQSINMLDVDEEGRLYILDEQAGNIKVFDRDGGFTKTIGRKGQGPGEFGLPISLTLAPDRQIIVNDMGQRKLLFFDRDGNYLEQISIADKFLFFGPRVTADGNMIAMHTVPSDKPETFLKKFTPDLEPILSFTSAHVERPPVADIFVALHMTRLLWNVIPNDIVIWADLKNPDYELYEHYRDGTLIRIISKEFDPIVITADDREKLMDRAFGDNPTRDQWDVRFPESYPPFSGFSFDDSGRLFVKRYEKETHPSGILFDIFDSERKYLAQMRFKMNPLIWKKGQMYSIEENEEGFQVVKRYKVNWKI